MNYRSLPPLLRAIAGSDRAKKEQTEIIFEEAAKIVDEARIIMMMLSDVPGDNALDKVRRLKEWYLEFSNAREWERK